MNQPSSGGWTATTPEELATLVARGYEVRGVEFKGPGPRTDANLFAKVTRAVLGMSNLRDGGRVVVGVDDLSSGLTISGLTADDVETWQYDHVAAAIAEYADPYVRFDLERVVQPNGTCIVLRVYEFDEQPILCRRDLTVKVNGKDRTVLRKSAMYVRSRHKPETAEVRTQEEMREVLTLAIDKGLRRFVERAYTVGLTDHGLVSSPAADSALFAQQGRDLL